MKDVTLKSFEANSSSNERSSMSNNEEIDDTLLNWSRQARGKKGIVITAWFHAKSKSHGDQKGFRCTTRRVHLIADLTALKT